MIDPRMTPVDPWLTMTSTAQLLTDDGATNAQQAEMPYTSPACFTYSSVKCRHCRFWNLPSGEADEAQKLKCRIVFRGTPKDDPDEDDWAEFEEAAKKEFAQLKKSGVLKNLELTDNRSRGQVQEATPDVSEEIITLRYCGLYTTALLEEHIDSRKDKKKVHTWPGCCKIANVLNAPLIKLRRYNTSGEDRCKIIRDMNLWCRECNPGQFIVPWNLRHVE